MLAYKQTLLNEFEPENYKKGTQKRWQKQLLGNDPKIATLSPIYRTFCLFLMQKQTYKKALIRTFLFTPNNADVKFIKICARSMNFAVHSDIDGISRINHSCQCFLCPFFLLLFLNILLFCILHIHFETKFQIFFVRQLKIVSVFE